MWCCQADFRKANIEESNWWKRTETRYELTDISHSARMKNAKERTHFMNIMYTAYVFINHQVANYRHFLPFDVSFDFFLDLGIDDNERRRRLLDADSKCLFTHFGMHMDRPYKLTQLCIVHWNKIKHPDVFKLETRLGAPFHTDSTSWHWASYAWITTTTAHEEQT